MTSKQMMQAVVEAVPGECWHDLAWDNQKERCVICTKCGMNIEEVYEDYSCVCCSAYAPSPTDLNALFGYAKKLRVYVELATDYDGSPRATVYANRKSLVPVTVKEYGADTPAEALLKALYATLPTNP